MQQKRKNTSPHGDFKRPKNAQTKSAFGEKFMSCIAGGISNDDSSDDEVAAFSAFDLPSYSSEFNEENGEVAEKDKGSDEVIVIGSNKPKGASKSGNTSGIIFLPDPSQLPTPLSFSTGQMMQPLVIGQPTGRTPRKVMVMNQRGTSGNSVLMPHVQPVVLSSKSAAKTQLSNRSVSRVSPQNKVSTTPVPMQRGRRSVPTILNTSPKGNVRTANTVAAQLSSRAQRVTNIAARNMPQQTLAQVSRQQTSVLSVSALIHQVAEAAAKAARMKPTQPTQFVLPQRQQGQAVRPIASNITARQQPLLNGRGMVRGRVPTQTTPQQQTAQAFSSSIDTKKWQPYSDTLSRISKKLVLTSPSGKKQMLNSKSPLSLKQVYSLLRLKFSTKQLFDMCLWDLENVDASLLQIAILNAFSG